MLEYATLCLALAAGSFFAAALASGFQPGLWAWGALGPVGWAIAFFLGVGARARQRAVTRRGRANRRRHGDRLAPGVRVEFRSAYRREWRRRHPARA